MFKSLSCQALLCLILFTAILSSCQKDVQTQIETKTITDTLDIDRPINLKATKGFYGTKITVTWTPMPLAQKYQLWRFDNITQKYALLKELADTTFDDTSIAKSLTKNFYKVRTFNNTASYSRFSDADFGYTSGLNYYKALSFGSEGKGVGQFDFALHLETDKTGNIYVSDESLNRVQKFGINGNFMELFYSGSGARAIGFFNNGNYVATRTQSSSYIQIFNANKQLIKEWGVYGTGDNGFGNVEELTIDDDQNIWIVDSLNDRIKKYDQNGNLLLKFGIEGRANGQFFTPLGVCYFKGNIYVSDEGRMQVFDKTGKYLRTWKTSDNYKAIKAKGDYLYVAGVSYVIKTDENGDVQEKIGVGQLNFAQAIALGVNDEIITNDVYLRKIVVFKKG
ncbi:NHL repeat-containing protein [Pedobacter mucosus]|uniref:NHL repeat-containing protein n=1 Tax=Pedobacter mucosus TaxID=2895286 RepID=UPI001EE4E733|nr:NHL repeat-containing protein [Pedobacter mucosus]UKT63147.1 hypothetical protein LOK61_15390 [Pedobacter mucosus]